MYVNQIEESREEISVITYLDTQACTLNICTKYIISWSALKFPAIH